MASAEVPSPRMVMRRFVSRCLLGLTWRSVGAVTLFCALYGAVLSLDTDTGGAPQSVAAYLDGFFAALRLFIPAFLVIAVTSSFVVNRPIPRGAALGIAAVIGVAVGYVAMTGIEEVAEAWQRQRFWLLVAPLPYVVVGWLGLAIYLLQEREKSVRQSLHDEAERKLNLDRQMSEAQLQVLQSQIEPHFLFNTLAHVRWLYQTDPRSGRTMMRHLSRYLSAALPAMRETSIGLAQDLELAVAYLNIQQIRMGPRLAFDIDVPAHFGAARIPPMSITTLVENAIKHGLSALPEGGSVLIDAQRQGDVLSIQVTDNGQGFQASLGAGVGLANIRARLATLHGPSAQLSLSQNSPRGVRAIIVVPIAHPELSPDDRAT